ncbi:MAG: hypothetical protein OSB14_05390, partial [Planctomycetota bacterium]|nr:hypothetical protein [Planctomycetota bacterium]
MKKLQPSTLEYGFVLLALIAQSACRATGTTVNATSEEEGVIPEVVELDRRQWKIGDLDALTLFFLEDDVPHHSTTITNNNATDRWWTGLKIYGY